MAETMWKKNQNNTPITSFNRHLVKYHFEILNRQFNDICAILCYMAVE